MTSKIMLSRRSVASILGLNVISNYAGASLERHQQEKPAEVEPCSTLDRIHVAENIDSLRALEPGRASCVITLGYSASGDGGGAIYIKCRQEVAPPLPGTVITTSGETWCILATQPINVRQFGAKGDGVTDDRNPVQATIEFIQLHPQANRVIRFPPGIYIIDSPLSTNINDGGYFLEGGGKSNIETPLIEKHSSSIKYTGKGTMISIRSGSNWLIRDINLIGNKEACCFNFTQPGNGSGLSTFERVSFVNWKVGVRFGSRKREGGCADVGFEFCEFNDCEIGVQVLNADGANYSFNRLYGRDTLTIIQSVPGSYNIKNSQIVGCGRFDRPCFEWLEAGDNSGFVIFDGIRFEQGTKRLISMRGKGRFSFIGGEEAQPPSQTSLFELVGISAHISNSRFSSGSKKAPLVILGANDGGQPSHLIFDQTYFHGDTRNEIYERLIRFRDDGVASSFSMRACTTGDRADLIPSSGGIISDGDIQLVGKSKERQFAELTTNGGPGQRSNRAQIGNGVFFAKITVLGIGENISIILNRNIHIIDREVFISSNPGDDFNPNLSELKLSVESGSLIVQVRGESLDEVKWRARCTAVNLPL